MDEVWKPVVGFEGKYEVSDLGRVRSLDRVTTQVNHWKSGIVRTMHLRRRGQMLKPGISSNGYPTVSLCRVTYCVHILVLTAFVGPALDGMECLHGDNDRANSTLKNLRWGTHVENMADRVGHGTTFRGEQFPTAKITDKTAVEIFKLKGIVSQSELAKQYGVSPAAVQAVHDRRTWKHITNKGAQNETA